MTQVMGDKGFSLFTKQVKLTALLSIKIEPLSRKGNNPKIHQQLQDEERERKKMKPILKITEECSK